MPHKNTYQHRITLVAGTIMIVVSMLVGVTFFIVMQRHTEEVLSKSLQLYLQSRIQLTETEIRVGFDKTVNISTRPLMIDQLQLVNARADDTAARDKLKAGTRSLLEKRLMSVALYGEDGQELARAGVFTQQPELAVPLNLPGHVQLMWDGQLLLRAVVEIKKEGRVVGKIMTEIQLPATMDALNGAVGKGETREQALCAPFGINMHCFPMALNPRVFTLPQRSLQGVRLPMAHALEGETGFIIAKDYRHQEVVAAYAPVGDLGLGMVVKMDRAELFAPVWQQLRFLIPLLVGILVIALLLLRWLFVPLVRRLIRSEEEALQRTAELTKEIVEHKLAEEKILHLNSNLEQMAHYDALTNLPNRTLLADRLNQAILQSHRYDNSLAVVFLDLDGFKDVNDAYGHDVGDELLIIVSLRMKEALRDVDTLARIGGDEFVVVIADLTNIEDSQPILHRLLLAASEPVTVGDLVLNVTASIGVTVYPQDKGDADQLIRHADLAMYVAKQAGKNCYRLFDTEHDKAVNIQRESLGNIRSALKQQEFVLYYQPKVNMHTGEVVGVEALIRWQHPVQGLVPPLEFLPAIEGHAISLDIGEWVIDTALSQISQWQKMGIHLSISVNISAYQLQQVDFIERLAALLAGHPDVLAQHLELEILETSALDVQHVSTIMNTCMTLGVRFALDDFGTGYSSLTYLRRLPVSLIKIDQTFVRDMLEDADDLAIIEGVVALAKSFKLEVIAEGVETIEHGTALLQLGCELAQGYGIAKPMAAGDVPAWISDWKPDDDWRKVDVE